jgi:hypothetical protein
MPVLKFSVILIILLIFVSPLFVSVTRVEASRDEAASALTNAEEDVVSTFHVILETEQAGINVSGLLARLNDAEGSLAEAKVAYGLGNFDEATRSANLCHEISESVKNQADELRLEASGQQYVDGFFKMVGSIFGVFVVGFGSFGAWRLFKRRYYRRVLEMKPEVSSDES